MHEGVQNGEEEAKIEKNAEQNQEARDLMPMDAFVQ